ncbi:MAG: MurR/RpiR family transcriptional regulator [Provencibacterium sp.]|nr:MurR/RpiR family transcriptional regulator [Provencibacterium sp.]
MSQDLLAKIASMNGKLSKGQRLIANYIVHHYERAAFMTAQKLGTAVGVSESTVVRFAYEIGYDGYPRLQRALQELIRNRLTSAQRMEVTGEQIGEEDVLQKILSLDIERIRSTVQQVSPEAFNRAVDAITSAQNIYILGIRSASALANFLYFYFNHIFKDLRLVSSSSSSEVFEQIYHIGPRDLLIPITFPRYSQRSIRAAQYAKSAGAAVLGITDTEHSPIAPYCDHLLCARSDMVSFVDSLVAPLSLINALIVAVGMRKKAETVGAYRELEDIWTEYHVYESASEGEAFP